MVGTFLCFALVFPSLTINLSMATNISSNINATFKGEFYVLNLLEDVQELSAIVLLFCGYAYLRLLKKTKRQRKLTKLEVIMYIITTTATFLFAGTYLLFFLDRNFG